jgi:pimeloyl-ACP methyl ester carboxylesterase
VLPITYLRCPFPKFSPYPPPGEKGHTLAICCFSIHLLFLVTEDTNRNITLSASFITMQASDELFVTLPNNVKICYQTFGDPADPAVILIPGGTGSMRSWPEQMIQLFKPSDGSQSYFVVRFDQRDTGRSKEFPVPADYTVTDMAKDVELLIDHLELGSRGFHLVGISLGGPIAYITAANLAKQVRSLTLLMCSPGATPDLPLGPGVDPGMLPLGFGDMTNDYIDWTMRLYDLLTTRPDPEERKAYLVGVAESTKREARSGTLYSKSLNHGAAGYGPRPGVEILQDLKCAATVVQSSNDPFFGVGHGEALAAGIKDAEYILWDDVGHEIPRRIWDRLAGVLTKTWKRGDDQWVG